MMSNQQSHRSGFSSIVILLFAIILVGAGSVIFYFSLNTDNESKRPINSLFENKLLILGTETDSLENNSLYLFDSNNDAIEQLSISLPDNTSVDAFILDVDASPTGKYLLIRSLSYSSYEKYNKQLNQYAENMITGTLTEIEYNEKEKLATKNFMSELQLFIYNTNLEYLSEVMSDSFVITDWATDDSLFYLSDDNETIGLINWKDNNFNKLVTDTNINEFNTYINDSENWIIYSKKSPYSAFNTEKIVFDINTKEKKSIGLGSAVLDYENNYLLSYNKDINKSSNNYSEQQNIYIFDMPNVTNPIEQISQKTQGWRYINKPIGWSHDKTKFATMSEYYDTPSEQKYAISVYTTQGEFVCEYIGDNKKPIGSLNYPKMIFSNLMFSSDNESLILTGPSVDQKDYFYQIIDVRNCTGEKQLKALPDGLRQPIYFY